MSQKQTDLLSLGLYSYLAVLSLSKGDWYEAVGLFAVGLIFLPTLKTAQRIKIAVNAGTTVYLFLAAIMP